MERGRERKRRTLWLSTDDGKTWNKVEALEGSVLYHREFAPGSVFNDGMGNLYRGDNPNS